MKAFKGTVIAAVVLIIVAVLAFFLKPDSPEPIVEDQALYSFEKPELVKVEIERLEDKLVLSDNGSGEWFVEGHGWAASKTMVNRVKHQIHDLSARATVIEGTEEQLELYGLGKNAIKVTLSFRDGESVKFLAGDPNPTAVSYYIQPIPGDIVYTVKKSALDYYGMKPDDFREPRFASFDSNDADRLEIQYKTNLIFQRVDDRIWKLEKPDTFLASREDVRRLLGRVTALKAQSYVEDHPKDLAKYGLDNPRARVLIKFSSRDPLELLIGNQSEVEDRLGKPRTYSYMMVNGDFTVYTAPDDLLNDFEPEISKLHLLNFMRSRVGDVTDITVKVNWEEQPVSIIYRADKWLWADGKPVSGSTPSRVALRAAEIEADEFVQDSIGDLKKWGFDKPFIDVELTDFDGNKKQLIIGKEASPVISEDGKELKRYYARASDYESVYIVSEGVVDVVEDLFREHNRKAENDAETSILHERINESIGINKEGSTQ